MLQEIVLGSIALESGDISEVTGLLSRTEDYLRRHCPSRSHCPYMPSQVVHDECVDFARVLVVYCDASMRIWSNIHELFLAFQALGESHPATKLLVQLHQNLRNHDPNHSECPCSHCHPPTENVLHGAVSHYFC